MHLVLINSLSPPLSDPVNSPRERQILDWATMVFLFVQVPQWGWQVQLPVMARQHFPLILGTAFLLMRKRIVHYLWRQRNPLSVCEDDHFRLAITHAHLSLSFGSQTEQLLWYSFLPIQKRIFCDSKKLPLRQPSHLSG